MPEKPTDQQILAALKDLLIVDLMKLDIKNKDIRALVGVDQARVDAISKLIRPKLKTN